jgi:outer membrane protein insertion porin family/translocation and assembly module TamA
MRRITKVFGARECLVNGALVRDVTRLMLYYRRLGFPRVAVDTLLGRPDSGAVNVKFVIREGAPIVVTSVELRGVTDSALRAQLQPAIQLRAGQPLSRFALDTSSANVLVALLRAGYLKGTARAQASVDSTASRALAWIDVVTGPLVRVGEVRIDARGVNETEPRLPAERVRGLTGLEPGSVLRSQDLTNARRVLDAVGMFDDVRIAVDSVRGPSVGEAVADVSVSTVEGLANQLKLTAGYATLDCFRLQLRHQHAGVFRRAGRFELTTNLSKIAIGSPLDFAPSVCSSAAQDDPYSRRLNYYVGGTVLHRCAGGRWHSAIGHALHRAPVGIPGVPQDDVHRRFGRALEVVRRALVRDRRLRPELLPDRGRARGAVRDVQRLPRSRPRAVHRGAPIRVGQPDGIV